MRRIDEVLELWAQYSILIRIEQCRVDILVEDLVFIRVLLNGWLWVFAFSLRENEHDQFDSPECLQN